MDPVLDCRNRKHRHERGEQERQQYLVPLLRARMDPAAGDVDGVVASGVASLIHLLLGYVCIEVGFERSNTVFLKIILGGTFVRMGLLVGAVFVLIRVYEFHTVSLMISFLLFFVLNLGLEIHLLQKKVALKR